MSDDLRLSESKALAAADRRRIAEQLDRYVDDLASLRENLDQGVRSLDAGRGRELDVEDLIAGARACGARRVVAQSFCGWPYARAGGPVKTEDDPLDPRPPRQQRNSLAAIRRLEDAVAGATGFEGLVLRYGAFYGPRSGLFDGPTDQIRRRRAPLIGEANGWWSFLHVDDAAAATALAIERGTPASTILSTTIRPRSANGCLRWPPCSARRGRDGFPGGWRGSRSANTWSR